MAYCGPSFAIPSCASAPAVGFGSAGLGYGGLRSMGSGLGSGSLMGGGAPGFAVPSCASAPVVGFGSASPGFASGVPSASLGVLSGVNPACINQIPPAEVVVQPPPVVMTLPGPILSATGEPVSVGGYTTCAVSYGGPSRVVSGVSGGYGGFGRRFSGGSAGLGLGGRLGSFGGRRSSVIVGRRGSTCLPPC